MPNRKKSISQVEWSQGNRDLLIELRTQMVSMVSGMEELHGEIKEIKDGMKSDIEFLKTDKLSRSDAMRLQVENQESNNDHETRLRFIERYMWSALAIIAMATFLLNYFHPFFSCANCSV